MLLAGRVFPASSDNYLNLPGLIVFSWVCVDPVVIAEHQCVNSFLDVSSTGSGDATESLALHIRVNADWDASRSIRDQ